MWLLREARTAWEAALLQLAVLGWPRDNISHSPWVSFVGEGLWGQLGPLPALPLSR